MLPIWLSSIKAEENPFLAQQMNGAQSFVYLKAGSICRTMSSTALAERQHRDHTGCKASVKSEWQVNVFALRKREPSDGQIGEKKSHRIRVLLKSV